MAVSAYRTTITIDGPNGQNINVFHNAKAGVAPADFGAVAVELYTGLYTSLLSLYPSGYTFAIEQIIDLDSTPPTYVPFVPDPFDITPSGSLEDFRLCATIGWKTAVASRRARGRTFIGPMNSSSIDSATGLFTSTVVDTLNAAALAFTTACTLASAPLVIFSRTADLIYTVTNHRVNNRTKTLRSRSLR